MRFELKKKKLQKCIITLGVLIIFSFFAFEKIKKFRKIAREEFISLTAILLICWNNVLKKLETFNNFPKGKIFNEPQNLKSCSETIINIINKPWTSKCTPFDMLMSSSIAQQ